MIYIIIALAGLLVTVALFTYFSKHKSTQPDEEIAIPPADCCGAHAVCEKGLKKAEKHIDYFDDEELDTFKQIASDQYSDDQIDQFRDVLYTLRREEIEDWLISLEKREISLPDQLKPETLDLLQND